MGEEEPSIVWTAHAATFSAHHKVSTSKKDHEEDFSYRNFSEKVGAVGLCRAQKGLAILSVLATASLAVAALPPLGAGILSTVGLVADSTLLTFSRAPANRTDSF